MAATLCEFGEGDEVIVPSFGYVTTASAFHARGAKVVFADSDPNRPHISAETIKRQLSPKTRALVIIHYAGMACDMEAIMTLVKQHKLILIEDCAHAINAYYQDKPLGSFGHLSTFSFHETKNIHCGEGGLLVVNTPEWVSKAENAWQEGTNRTEFKKGLTDKYEWVSLGSSYQPSELSAAFLYAQLEHLEQIHRQRLSLWSGFYDALKPLEEAGFIYLPLVNDPGYNGHIFYLQCRSKAERDALIHYLTKNGIMAIFHYLPLHLSPYWLSQHTARQLPYAKAWSDRILRLPLYYSLNTDNQQYITDQTKRFFSAG